MTMGCINKLDKGQEGYQTIQVNTLKMEAGPGWRRRTVTTEKTHGHKPHGDVNREENRQRYGQCRAQTNRH